MKLYVARHAWAGNYGDAPPPGADWSADEDRPLTPEGVERYRRVVEELADRGFAPEHVATSPLRRCVQTARLIAEATGAEVTELESLAIGAEIDELIAWTRTLRVRQACWVGRNPDVERMVAWLIGSSDASIRFAKGSIAAVRFPDGTTSLGRGVLEWHVTAKSLGV